MNKHFYIFALFAVSFGVKAQKGVDTLTFTSAEAEKISSLEQQVIELTSFLEGLQGTTELLVLLKIPWRFRLRKDNNALKKTRRRQTVPGGRAGRIRMNSTNSGNKWVA